MNVVVIGGTRFIGAAVVRQLVSQGHFVTAYHRGIHNSSLPASVRNIQRAEAEMPVMGFVAELLKPAPDVVIHMIAMGEADAKAASEFFRGRTGRVVWLSSGDVYLAYGRFTGLQLGAIEATPLSEDAPLRTVFYPYRDPAKSAADLANIYEKILVEHVGLNDPALPGTVLRLPKVYGREDNADLATVYGFRDHPQWRWTHGYVENVAAAIVLASTNAAASGRIYNVGEQYTPTIAQRLAKLPPSKVPPNTNPKFNFEQDIVYDTSRIRRELGYVETVPEEEAMRAVSAETAAAY